MLCGVVRTANKTSQTVDEPPSKTPQSEGRVRERFACIDGLRAIAALSVFVVHARGSHPFVGNFLGRLGVGVTIFFVLSGFLLYYPFASAHFGGQSAPSTARYFRRRALRIFPAYWVVLAVTIFLSQSHYNAFDILVHSLLLQIYRKGYIWGPVAQAWSLCAEMAFYIFLPAYAWAISKPRRAGRQQLLIEMAAPCFMYLLAFLLRYYYCAFGNREVWGHLQPSLPGQVDWFALGMFLAVGRAWYKGREQPWILAHPLFPMLCWIVTASAFWIVSTELDLPEFQWGRVLKPWQELGQRFLYGLIAVALVAPTVFGPERAGLMRQFLQTWPMRKLGMISYGIFLWHLLFLDLFPKNVVAAFSATLVTATASYYIIQKPLLGRGARSAESRMAAP
jgi:peptidoglycan/LPS O-acetylase OafA/YrhL